VVFGLWRKSPSESEPKERTVSQRDITYQKNMTMNRLGMMTLGRMTKIYDANASGNEDLMHHKNNQDTFHEELFYVQTLDESSAMNYMLISLDKLASVVDDILVPGNTLYEIQCLLKNCNYNTRHCGRLRNVSTTFVLKWTGTYYCFFISRSSLLATISIFTFSLWTRCTTVP